MFKLMLGLMGGGFVILWGIITALVGVMWHDLRTRISSQRAEDKDRCERCDLNKKREFDALWHTLEECCNKIGITVNGKGATQ